MDSDFNNTKLIGPYDNDVTVYHSNGLVWATVRQWCSVLDAPYFMPEYLDVHAEESSKRLKNGHYCVTVKGKRLYRWPAIAASLDMWHRNWMVRVSKKEHITMGRNERAASETFALKMALLKQWGYELQERELQQATSKGMTQTEPASGLADINQAIQAIQGLAHVTHQVLEKHAEAISEHELRIAGIESTDPGLRDPRAYVTVKQRCAELAISLGFIVDGKMNVTQACGYYLQKEGYSKGTAVKERLDGVNRIVEVATWRREDIDEAIRHYLPTFFN